MMFSDIRYLDLSDKIINGKDNTLSERFLKF